MFMPEVVFVPIALVVMVGLMTNDEPPVISPLVVARAGDMDEPVSLIEGQNLHMTSSQSQN
jgi:hypothetical protein